MIVWLARVSLVQHGACSRFSGSARGVQIGTGQNIFSARVEQFSSSEVGTLTFSQYSGFIMIQEFKLDYLRIL